MQDLQVANEHAFELRAVGAAVRLTGVMEYAVGVCEGFYGCFCDGGGGGQVCGVRRGFVEFHERAEDDALVVGPYSAVVILTRTRKSIVNQRL